MKVEIKCFSTLADGDRCDYTDAKSYDLADNQTVGDLAEKVGIAKDDIKVAFVNNRRVNVDTVLNDGDRVGLAPAVGGM